MTADATKQGRCALLLLVMLTCVGCDRATKVAAQRYLKPAPTQHFLGDTVRVQYVENPGAFLGMGGNLSPAVRFWTLVVVNAVLLAVVLAVLVVKWDMPRPRFLALTLLLSGGVGNLIDRSIQDGMVIDFLNVGIGGLRTGIFNIADMAITGAVLMLLYLSWYDETTQRNETANGGMEGA